MPPLPSVPDVLRVDVQWTIADDTSISTRQYFRYSGGPPTSTDCVNLAADIYAAMASVSSLWVSEVTLEGVKVTDLSSPSGGIGEHAQPQNGTDAGLPVSAGTCTLVNYVIARRYRGGKPRSYWPFGGAGNLQTPRQWQATYLTQVDSGLSTFYGAVIGLSSGTTTITNHVNISYYQGFTAVQNPVTKRWKNIPNLRTTPLVDVILSYSASARPGSQRRRN